MEKVNILINDGENLQYVLAKIKAYMGLSNVSLDEIVFQKDTNITISYEKKSKPSAIKAMIRASKSNQFDNGGEGFYDK